MIVSRKVILHIEDDAGLARTVASILHMEGYSVVTAYTAEEGLRKISQVQPSLIILDMSMPGMSGLTVLRQIADSDGRSRIPVLVFTAFAGMIDEEIRQRADGFILKPTSMDGLLAEVARIITEHSGA